MAVGEGKNRRQTTVGKGALDGGRIATASVRTGFAMTPFQEVRWVSLWCVGEGLCPSHGRGRTPPLRRVTGGAMGGRPQGSPLRKSYKGCGKTGRCGERTERCRWQKQRSERVAAVKILSVRRKAAQKFWAPQQDHRPRRRDTGGAMGGRPQGSPLRSAARNVWAGYRPLRKFFDREGMVCFGFWWRRMTRAPGC